MQRIKALKESLVIAESREEGGKIVEKLIIRPKPSEDQEWESKAHKQHEMLTKISDSLKNVLVRRKEPSESGQDVSPSH